MAWRGGCGRWKAAASRRLIFGTVSGIIPGVFRRSLVSGGGWRGLGIGTVFEQGGGDRTDGQGGHYEHDVAGDRGWAPGLSQLPVPLPGSLANQRHAQQTSRNNPQNF